jgi:hypothetical protein
MCAPNYGPAVDWEDEDAPSGYTLNGQPWDPFTAGLSKELLDRILTYVDVGTGESEIPGLGWVGRF